MRKMYSLERQLKSTEEVRDQRRASMERIQGAKEEQNAQRAAN